ncbi:Crp/Fnr family transcriptional regulator [Streptomyces sp. 5-8]|uniref:Crp/Fnr family transcriptional regulator n=1 Tax=Streptomyces musisoli TaxID=2802280 RepID=A0ABS1P3K6_9ACTN|nr:Crp/Fnr family transcriptional regulator [Streptomyces musisoli]MBL1106630.1 Crp/Fnr family transcriptional regulator [Streptomyces musisoli]
MPEKIPTGPQPGGRWPHGTLLAELAGSGEAVKALLSLGTPRTYAPGETLLGEGRQETFVLLLMTGVTKVTALSENGDTALLAVRLGGELVGEFAALDNGPRSATVTAAGAVTVRRIGQRDFLGCLDRYPAAALAVSRMLVRKNRWSVRRRGEFGSCPVATRVARVLLDLVEDYGRPQGDGVLIGPRLTQAEIAGLVGAGERRVHHALGELAHRGVVQVGYSRLTILSPDELRMSARLTGTDEGPEPTATTGSHTTGEGNQGVGT